MRARRLATLAVAAALGACGPEVAPGGRPAAAPTVEPAVGPRMARKLEATDLIPADLDMVLRVDLARMRAGLGPASTLELTRRALPGPDDAQLSEAMTRADVVWIGTRIVDAEAGDRVVVLEGSLEGLSPDSARFTQSKSALADVSIFDRQGPIGRGATARVVVVGKRTMAFVSAVEVASVDRVLREGPDDKRGDPPAEGVVSVDVRAHRLPPPLERRFPSIGALVAGLDRVRGTVNLADDGARVEVDVVAKTPGDGARALSFLRVLRDNAEDPRYKDVLAQANLDQLGKTVQLRWLIPAPAVLAFLEARREP